jgi:hypothetical protein
MGQVRVELGFESNVIMFFRISSHFGSGRGGLGFGFLVAQVMSGFRSFGSGSSRILGHLISDSLGFQVISGRTRPGQVLFCDVLFGSGQILGRQTLKKIEIHFR